ncbi:MAG: hypothetical protein KGL39_16595 [Patescibacteria group bacterium]|nr:hypothetical protein [Patescibacteria group bacterium]
MGLPSQTIPQELWDTVEALKGVFGQQTQSDYTAEKLDFIAKTFGISSGFQPYDLSEAAYYLQPVFSPFRNRMPRLHLQGKNMEFKSVTNVDLNNTSGMMAEGKLAPSVLTQFADVTTAFKAYGASSDPVTFEELYSAVGRNGDFSVDARAVAVANLLKAVYIKEERLFLGGVGAATQIATVNNSPVNGLTFTIGGPIGNAPPGGALAANTGAGSAIPNATTVYFKYAAVSAFAVPTGMATTAGSVIYGQTHSGESLCQVAEGSLVLGSGGPYSVVFTPPAYTSGPPILGWKLYLSNASGTELYAGFTTGAPITITALPVATQTPPTQDNSAGTAVAGGTGSSVEGAMNGILAWLWGTNSGATNYQVNGTLTLNEVYSAYQQAFTNNFADPDEFWVSSKDIMTLTSLLTGGSGQPYWFAANQGAAQGEMTMGFRVSRFLNPITSKLIPVNVHAYLPQGTLLGLTTQLPPWYVGNNVPDVWVWGGSMDYLEVDYQPTANNKLWISEIEAVGAIHCFLPSQNLMITGVS